MLNLGPTALGNRCSIRLSYGAKRERLCAIASGYASFLGTQRRAAEGASYNGCYNFAGNHSGYTRLTGPWR